MQIKFLSIVEGSRETGRKRQRFVLLSLLTITIKEYPNTLEGARTDDIRKIFGAWLQSKEAKAELCDGLATNPEIHKDPRYIYRIYIYGDALDLVARHAPQPPQHDSHGIGYWICGAYAIALLGLS